MGRHDVPTRSIARDRIALEFNHTLQYAVKREQSIIQTKVVLLIALLAMARKFIILDSAP